MVGIPPWVYLLWVYYRYSTLPGCTTGTVPSLVSPYGGYPPWCHPMVDTLLLVVARGYPSF